MKIKCAAIRYNGKLHEGRDHGEIIQRMIRARIVRHKMPKSGALGFVTDDGCFFGRTDALEIAIESGQVKRGETLSPNELYSADIEQV